MKKCMLWVIGLGCIVSLSYAQKEPSPAQQVPENVAVNASITLDNVATIDPNEDTTITIKGTIIDAKCVALHKDDMAEFIKTHTKECALKSIEAPGHYIFSEGILYSFDFGSTFLILDFLAEQSGSLRVIVEAKKAGESYSLISIKSQE
ncbi:MAG: hypothetical protein KKC84_05595 [Candidatus Omnitrophica bacterium]|nr:hypothetical protein [Candidatus Omnitrophota bacterium]